MADLCRLNDGCIAPKGHPGYCADASHFVRKGIPLDFLDTTWQETNDG